MAMWTPGEADLIIYQGASFDKVFTLSEDGVVKNLTGYEARMSIKELVTDTTAIITLTSSPAAGITITALAGQLRIVMTPTQTKALNFEVAYYDIEIYTAADAEVLRVLQGTVTLSKEITK